MDPNFKYKATLRTDDELQYIVDNREKYLPETVEASIDELQARGTGFTEEELKVFNEDMQARRELANANHDGFMRYTADAKDLQVADPDAPELYSKRAILVFSILFSVFFGSVLLAINLAKTGQREKAAFAVLFGFGFTLAGMLAAAQLNLNSGFAIAIGWIGAYCLDLIFWKQYIGNSTLYRLKPIWWPLGIGFALVIVVMILKFQGNGFNFK